MPRYKLLIEYNGTAYCGWQKQPDVNTIQEELEKALSRILQQPVTITGQGRTDSGVHAEAQVAHFDSAAAVKKDMLLYALLGVLPRDISVWDMQQVQNDFHARFDAKWRQYRYRIVTRPSPLLFKFAALVRGEIDWDIIKQCAMMIEGTHDFTCFSKANKDQKNAVCSVEKSELIKQNYVVTYHIRANRFVHHMVRRLIGSMLQVGKGKCSYLQFKNLLDHPNSRDKGHGATAKGLILEKVEY